MIKKEILYIDMDGVLVDLSNEVKVWFEKFPHLYEKYKDYPDHIPGVYRNPIPIGGAIEGIQKLQESGKYDMYILSTSPWGNPSASTDKRFWIEQYFGELFHKRLILTHNKNLLRGDILIDDNVHNGAGEFEGTHLHFGSSWRTGKINKYPNWGSILKELL